MENKGNTLIQIRAPQIFGTDISCTVMNVNKSYKKAYLQNIPKPKAPVDFTEKYLQKRSSLSVLPQSYGHKIRNCYKIEVKKF